MTSFRESMLSSAASNKSRVVLALDFSGPYDRRLARAEEVLEATKRGIAAVKVNHHLLLPFGLQGLQGIIGLCRREGLPLIADLKINDIESTNLNIVESLFDFGFSAVIANPFVGREEGLGKVVQRVHSRGGGILFLVYMSHKGAEEGYALRLEGGEPLYRVFAERARDWKADGVVVSAKSADKVAETRNVVGKDCLIFCPGVGAQGGDAKAEASSEADFLIVGRSITESADPRKALRDVSTP
ncbi:MAG: orotidine-5'-phosphate decarboxylase [Nitrososphaerales archaeon]